MVDTDPGYKFVGKTIQITRHFKNAKLWPIEIELGLV